MQVGRYRIMEKLGAGGMGVVYRARALGADGFQKPVVIKRIHGHLAMRPDLLRRFINEAKIAMGMTHGNVVQVLDLGKMGREYFIALEYIDGRDLRSVLKRCIEIKEWLAPEISLHILCQALRGLDYAHRRTDPRGQPLGIVHRDVTPANILCSFEGEVKLTDFGIARALAWASSTQAGAIRGSIKYMSPEQARGATVDQRSDIFSVGAVLYLLLCRAHPFPTNDMQDVLDQVREAAFLTPAERGVELPEELETVLLTAMAREPDDRYPTAAAMLAALENYQRTIAHATSSDLQALMQRLFEGEIVTASDSVDRLVGAEIEVAGDPGHDPLGLSVYSLGSTQADTVSATPSGLDVESQAQTVSEPDPALLPGGHAPSTGPGTPRDPSVTEAFAAQAGLGRSRLVLLGLGGLCLLAVGSGVAIWLGRSQPPPAASTLVVKTDPPGAHLLLEGQSVPKRSPVVLPNLLRGKTYRVSARLDDHADAEARVPLDRASHSVNLRLRRTVGRLSVTSEPTGAAVLVDQRPCGHTPLTLKLPIGRRIRLAVQLTDRSWSQELSLSPQKSDRALHIDLPPTRSVQRRTRPPKTKSRGAGWVRIDTRAARVEVHEGGRLLGTTPCRVQLPAGIHALRLFSRGLDHSVTRQVNVHPGAEVEFVVDEFGGFIPERPAGARGPEFKPRKRREESELLSPYPADRRGP